jgi:hypothetical protein
MNDATSSTSNPGERFQSGAYNVTAEEIINFALAPSIRSRSQAFRKIVRETKSKLPNKCKIAMMTK